MTWYVTWPEHGRPKHEEAPHETAAERRAKELVDSGRARVATFFEVGQVCE